jgi:hypothetical protein
MPIYTSQHTLGTATAVQIAGSHYMAQDVTVHNMTKSSNEYVYVGGPDVTIGNGIHIDPGGTLQLKIQPGDGLYAVSDPDGLEVGVFQSLQGG